LIPDFNTFFGGGEFIITGKLDTPSDNKSEIEVIVNGDSDQNKFSYSKRFCFEDSIWNPCTPFPILSN